MFAKIPRTAKTQAVGTNAIAFAAITHGGNTASASPTGTSAQATTPFWELEALIAQGHAASEALAIMAKARAGGPLPILFSGDCRLGGDVRLSA